MNGVPIPLSPLPVVVGGVAQRRTVPGRRQASARARRGASAGGDGCFGKGRKTRCTPLTAHTVAILDAWMQERQGQPDDPLFPTRRGTALSTDAVALLVKKHATQAGSHCPTLRSKTVTPHVLRHSAAMALLSAGSTPR